MNIPESRTIKCADCGTKRKMMRFKQTCEAIVCLACQSLHPNNCQICLEAIKNRPIPSAKPKLGANFNGGGQVGC